MKSLNDKQIVSVYDVYEHVHTKAKFKVVAFDMKGLKLTFKVELIENKNDVEHHDGMGSTIRYVGNSLWISNYYDNIGGVANLISKGIKNNVLVAEALVKIN